MRRLEGEWASEIAAEKTTRGKGGLASQVAERRLELGGSRARTEPIARAFEDDFKASTALRPRPFSRCEQTPEFSSDKRKVTRPGTGSPP
jgi:hypothetical protein